MTRIWMVTSYDRLDRKTTVHALLEDAVSDAEARFNESHTDVRIYICEPVPFSRETRTIIALDD